MTPLRHGALSFGAQAATINEPGFSEVLVANVGLSYGFGDLASDAAGNIYATGGYSNQVYKITPAGVVSQFGDTGTGSSTLGVSVVGSALYVGFDSGDIRTMDLSQAAPTGVLLANIGGGNDAMGMALAPAGFGPYGGQLVVGSYNGISIVNPTNGDVTTLISPGSPHSDIEFTADGTLLATDYNGGRIVSVSAAGVVTEFHAGPVEPDGIAIEPATGEVFVASDSPTPGSITRISADGTTSSVFANDADFDSGWFISPIEFSPDGTLLFYGAGEGAFDVFAISGFSGVTPPPQPTSVVPVPTLSQWGLLVLGFFTLLVSLFSLRTRKDL